MSALRVVGAVSAVMAIGALGILIGGRTYPLEVPSVAVEASPATEAIADLVPVHLLAERTVDRLRLFRSSDGPASLTLGSDEVTALITETLPGLLPAGVDDINVELQRGGIQLRVQVLTENWVGAWRLGPVLSVLPDTLRAEIDGDLVLIGRRLRLRVSAARANGVLLPGPIVDALLAELPSSVIQAEGPVLQVALPDGIGDMRIVGDQLILYAYESTRERAVDDQDHD